MNNKGFAITSFLYSIFLLIIIFLILILLLMGNSSISYFRIQKQVKDKLDEITYSTGGINNYAIITFEKDNIIIKKGESIDLLEDVKVIRYDGEEINNSIIYTSKPIFDNNKVGKYVIYYEATVDGRLIKKNRVITVKEQTFNQEGIYITDVQIKNKENSNIVYSKNTLTSTIELKEQENIVTITFYNHTNNNYGLTNIIKKEYSNEFIKFEVIDNGNILVSKEYTTIRLKFSYLNNTTDKTLKSILEFQFEEIPYVIASYNYTGKVEEFIVPYTGIYKIELWGASGGEEIEGETIGGYGAYTNGEINLEKGKILYFYIGEMGKRNLSTTFNGGGKGAIGGVGYEATEPEGYFDYSGFSGGGATDVRLEKGSWDSFESLKSRIMVAAGGGGQTNVFYSSGGESSYAGGLTGYSGGYYIDHPYVGQNGKGATQTSGGAAGIMHFESIGTISSGSFGIGGGTNSYSSKYGAGGGGGGYYGGGGASGTIKGGMGQGGGGGSSFISGHNGCNAIKEESTKTNIIHTNQSIHYSGYQFFNTKMIDGSGYNWTTKKGNYIGMPSYEGNSTIMGNIGNGYAKITFLGSE